MLLWVHSGSRNATSQVLEGRLVVYRRDEDASKAYTHQDFHSVGKGLPDKVPGQNRKALAESLWADSAPALVCIHLAATPVAVVAVLWK